MAVGKACRRCRWDGGGIALNAVRPRRELVRENALLRHQLVMLRRKVPRPKLISLDRLRLALSAAVLPGWQRLVASFVRKRSCDGEPPRGPDPATSTSPHRRNNTNHCKRFRSRGSRTGRDLRT